MTIEKPSTSSSKQQRTKAHPVAKKRRGKSKLKKQLRFSEVPESLAAECCEADLFHRRHEIWFTKEDLTEFHKDRLQTIKKFRASGRDVSGLDADTQCVRGLEMFSTPQGHRELQGSRKLHKSTVMLEQARQNLSNIKDADRFHTVVAPQSEAAQKRAQELAALDEVEATKVYNTATIQYNNSTSIPRTLPAVSLPLSVPLKKGVKNNEKFSLPTKMTFLPQAPGKPSLSLLKSPPLRALQEDSARRRVMELCFSNQDGATTTAPPGGLRVPIPRDSLARSARLAQALMILEQDSA